jgi:hypothetical protein
MRESSLLLLLILKHLPLHAVLWINGKDIASRGKNVSTSALE